VSFSVTAEHFQVPSSSVSRRIKDLEQELGAALFERTTRTVRLTDLGRLYLREVSAALQSIDMADELVGAQSRSPSGMLRITAMPGYGERFVLPALEKLRERYNDIDFDVNFTDEVINLASNEVDIAIRAASTLPEQTVARRLGDHDFILVTTQEYIDKHGTPKSSSDLSAHTVFMYRTQHGVLDWLVQSEGVWKAIDLNPKYITNHGQSLLDSVLHGRGIAFLPRWGVANDIAQNRLIQLTLEDGPLSSRGGAQMGMYLLYHPPKFRLQKIRVTVDFLVEELGF
jgi:DNA-binding transcriptional LysR family regulator